MLIDTHSHLYLGKLAQNISHKVALSGTCVLLGKDPFLVKNHCEKNLEPGQL